MFSKPDSLFRTTAAWRFSVLTTVAFAFGTAAAFFSVDLVVAAGIRDRSDAWLQGESELLTQVVETTPSGDIYERLVDEVAELARHEVLPAQGVENPAEQPIFFLVTSEPGEALLWVGPSVRRTFLAAIEGKAFTAARPWSLQVEGWDREFRVVSHHGSEGRTVFLGFIDRNALALLGKVTRTFIGAWLVTLLFGSLISWLGARRILCRVQRITDIASRVGAEGLNRRLPVGKSQDEISRLAETFNLMLDRIQASVEQVHVLCDSLAHDLRSPITVIRGNLEMALMHGSPLELGEAASTSLEGLDRLLLALNTSMDVAEAEGGMIELHRKRVDLRRLVKDMVEMYRPAAEDRGLAFETNGDGPAFAYVDPQLLRRAVANLLDNAIQHLHPGCHVDVAAIPQGDSIVISVVDDGDGFPAEIRERAFERFVRGSSSQGSGLGLALARAAARVHGGDAEILESPTHGAQINLSLPCEHTPSA